MLKNPLEVGEIRGFLTRDDNVKMPTRATFESAGYDFYVDEAVSILPNPGVVVKVSTGIRSYMGGTELLMLALRSSLSIKGLILSNGVGIVDSDFYPNEIKFLVRNLSSEIIDLAKGDRIGQGIFLTFLTSDNDESEKTERIGGFGSTGA